MYDILDATRTPSTKTRLVSKANLYTKQVDTYVGILLRAGLLETIDERKYHVSSKGKEYMLSFEKLKVMTTPAPFEYS
jgi:predicted transcriptional regulator